MTDTRMARVIRTMTDGLEPAVPLPPVRVRTWRWVALSVLSIGAVTGIRGLRQDVSQAAPDSAFVLQLAVMGVMAGVAGVAALRLAVPGADRPRGRVWILGALGLWPVALVLWDLLDGGTAAHLAREPLHLTCTKTISLAASLPAFGLSVMIRRGAPLRPSWAGAMTGVAAAAVGATAVALTCPISRASHLLMAHALPTLAVAGILCAVTGWVVRRRPSLRTIGAVMVLSWMSAVAIRAAAPDASTAPVPSFRVAASTGGYLSSGDLLEFLRDADEGTPLANPLAGRGPLLIAGIILLGGVLLNLTPCVLPMIPINLAIIGAGRAATSRRRGGLLGAAYGAAMAVVYGLLGGGVVATTGAFGILNGSPWFNAAIAVLFVVLGLAMFDVFFLDVSRWTGRVRAGSHPRGGLVLAFFMGGIAALMAGACVAPVVIQVVALPLILGVGMGLPWPFAGAGLAALPKPGAWMIRIKQGLGVCILLTAAYYGYEAARLAWPRHVTPVAATEEGWYQSLDAGLAEAAREGKPVFLDVWATWCKNCGAMDATTFRDPVVCEALNRYVRVRFQAEDLQRPDVMALLDRLDSIGLPTYAVLRPGGAR